MKMTSFSSSDKKRDFLSQIDLQKDTLVVSDLKSKKELKKKFIKKTGFLEEDSVLRIHEFWRKLFLQTHTNQKIISMRGAKALSRQWSGSASTLFYLEKFLPVLIHEEGKEAFYDWLSESSSRSWRLKGWFEKSLKLWESFCKKGLIPSRLVPATLMEVSSLSWRGKVFFDLGVGLTPVEGDVLEALKHHLDFEILEPHPEWRDSYAKALWSYSYLKKNLIFPQEVTSFFKPSSHFVFEKHISCLTEVKSTVAQVRKWVEEGVALDKIALLSPKIEEYLPVLEPHLKEEGLSIQRKKVVRLHGLPSVQRWLSSLRLRAGLSLQIEDMESSFYTYKENPYRYAQFCQMASQVYEKEDLKRWPEFYENLKWDSPSLSMNLESFLSWCLKDKKCNPPSNLIEKAFSDFYKDMPSELEMSLENWFFYLEQVCSETEEDIDSSQGYGLHCENLISAENIEATHFYIMGLSQSFLEPQSETVFLLSDVFSLLETKGFALDWPESSSLEFELTWFLSRSQVQCILSQPETHFSGNVLQPSSFWLRGALDRGFETQPIPCKETFWDHLKQKPISDILSYGLFKDGASFQKSFQQDRGEIPLPSFGENLLKNLSPSSLETCFQCPFKLGAGHIFKLKEDPEKGVDPDPMSQGRFLHAVLEVLTEKEPLPFEASDEDLCEILDRVKEEEDIFLGEEGFWPLQRQKFLKKIKAFLKFEGEYKTSFPDAHIVGREVKFKGYWDLDKKNLFPYKEGELLFRGSIDRVDEDSQKRKVIWDYKSSSIKNLKNFKSWMENGNFQLWLYAHAVENGLTDLGPSLVSGAFYYSLKEFQRNKGMGYDAQGESFFPSQTPSNRIQGYILKDRSDFDEKMREVIQKQVEKIQKGEFAPKPHKESQCKKCQWRKVCRAPHL